MKYIIDLDALKDCLDLLRNPVVYAAGPCVYLDEVKEMIDRFPKEEYGNEYRETIEKLVNLNENNKVNQDILNGKGLHKI